MSTAEPPRRWCPSGDPGASEAVVLAVRSGAQGRAVYLADPVPAAEVLDAVPPGVEPRRILRFASHCVSGCANRRGEDCTLIERIQAYPVAAEQGPVPRCHLRPRCMWWHQTGVAACARCPAIATRVRADDELAAMVADPATTPRQLAERMAEADPAPG